MHELEDNECNNNVVSDHVKSRHSKRSTIVVARDSRPFDAIKITQIVTPILADLATSAAAIAAISD